MLLAAAPSIPYPCLCHLQLSPITCTLVCVWALICFSVSANRCCIVSAVEVLFCHVRFDLCSTCAWTCDLRCTITICQIQQMASYPYQSISEFLAAENS